MNTELIAVFTETGVIIDKEATKNKSFYVNDKLLADCNKRQAGPPACGVIRQAAPAASRTKPLS
jgi:hypothetical protein